MQAYYIQDNMKFFFTGVIALITCVSVNAKEASFIFIDENALIYRREFLYVAQEPSQKITKKTADIKKEAPTPDPEPTDNIIAKQEPIQKFFAFPFKPSSSYSKGSSKPAAVFQQRHGGQQQIAKAFQKSTYQANNNLNLTLYLPQQRQKLSIAATQCGTLTSFGSQSPPL